MTENKTDLPRKKKGEKDRGDAPGKFRIAQIKEFYGEVKREFTKIAWPNKKNTVTSAVVVIVFVTIMALYLGSVDLVIGKLVSLVLN
ncbi:MAG: preprotein translocase subunit SecE [Desulfobulbales bacterium]|nr:preprotein translocase subunit SecE [Desulfobulbales bacterium]